MGQQQEKLNNYFNQVPKIQIKIYLVRGKATLFDRIKIFWISAMADLQEIIKTHTKSYPSYLDTYPRNGKTTVLAQYKNIATWAVAILLQSALQNLLHLGQLYFCVNHGISSHLSMCFGIAQQILSPYLWLPITFGLPETYYPNHFFHSQSLSCN